jgi:hypothetical protein
VTIGSVEENDFLSSFGHFWMGFSDEVVEGEWRWIDGTLGIWQDPDDFSNPIQTAYTNWESAEPNDHATGEDAAEHRSNGRWNDGNVMTPQRYIVEWEPLPIGIPGDTNNDGLVDITDINNVLNNFRLGELGGPPIPGDAFPFDGVVDLGDLNLVRNHFGTSADTAAVPEPAGFVLATLALLAAEACAWGRA